MATQPLKRFIGGLREGLTADDVPSTSTHTAFAQIKLNSFHIGECVASRVHACSQVLFAIRDIYGIEGITELTVVPNKHGHGDSYGFISFESEEKVSSSPLSALPYLI